MMYVMEVWNFKTSMSKTLGVTISATWLVDKAGLLFQLIDKLSFSTVPFNNTFISKKMALFEH